MILLGAKCDLRVAMSGDPVRGDLNMQMMRAVDIVGSDRTISIACL